MAVTAPAGSIVALVLLILHVPPGVASVNGVMEDTQTLLIPVICAAVRKDKMGNNSKEKTQQNRLRLMDR
jgi:hypothetical protein